MDIGETVKPQIRPKDIGNEYAGKRLLTFNDILSLSSQSLGLRHVSSRAIAERELREGVHHGDALALSDLSHIFARINPKYYGQPKAFVTPHMPEYEKVRAVEMYEDALAQFVLNSLRMDLNLNAPDQETVAEAIARLKDRPAFLVAEFKNANRAYDHMSYLGLGKCDPQTISPDHIKSVIYPEEVVSAGGIPHDYLQQPMGKDTFDFLTKLYSVGFHERILTDLQKQARV